MSLVLVETSLMPLSLSAPSLDLIPHSTFISALRLLETDW